MTHIIDYPTDQKYQAEVISSQRLTPEGTDEIRELILEVLDDDFTCAINNSFGVLVNSAGMFGNTFHHRLYSVSDLPSKENGKTRITMLVKRCKFLDEFSGEEYNGICSNYLCDRKEGEVITITGPFDLAFNVPKDNSANMILIGMGTGIAPFRAFIKHIYNTRTGWRGKVRLFYGAKTGLEMPYMNEENGDLKNYYDEETFKAFQAISPRPHWADPVALDAAMVEQAEEILEMLSMNNTYVYVAGFEKVRDNLNRAFAEILGSKEAWESRKAELVAGGKWAEVIY
ncbi:ferredoxin--NADP(+) reductase [Persicobacter sp. CCB-QB2]|uniref:ferredoxin--NADP(+) reductase n=1 Tax=Persicobacter sp. CCB-QB2 TaxID=1561025 RepID=UPI0006A9DC35|nr:ferredoxin--NADP(+) reductase [Persicobacter sp. CCB-QB2]